jgi:hypothetical protein
VVLGAATTQLRLQKLLGGIRSQFASTLRDFRVESWTTREGERQRAAFARARSAGAERGRGRGRVPTKGAAAAQKPMGPGSCGSERLAPSGSDKRRSAPACQCNKQACAEPPTKRS